MAANDFEAKGWNGDLATTALLSTICLAAPVRKAETQPILETKNVQDWQGGLKLSLIGADLRDANLKANLTSANLGELTGAKSQRNKVYSSFYWLAMLAEDNLTGVSFSGAKLYSAEMDGAILVGTDFKGAKLYGVDLSR